MQTPYFSATKPILWPARTSEFRDVVIRLIRKGDEGLEHLDALRAVAKGELSFHVNNHCVPVLQELTLEDMTFVVFPLLGNSVDYPWFYDFHEVFEFVFQAVESVAYLHEHLIAHLDIDIDNFLINFAGDQRCPEWPDRGKFRSFFPVRYYLGDMELCVRFSEDSDPSSRKIVGHPTLRIGVDPSKYGRELVPEMAHSEPYCPFKADVWQLGNMLSRMFQPSAQIIPELFALSEAMKSLDPNDRPTSAQALDRVRHLRAVTPESILSQEVPPQPDC
ncbi:hypothetical protein SISSUDRAFT_223602 [Sistotremastrum suecicum HHB10207 ss-3]|uniref:Protein kinase domain-containing protein n=1 Tax=Sistotremastrum suecicum HHB10207 ss-3 TaxID=1314776 RepID=A0A166A4Q2_9AGAM|nr:hypothetical protein SISSUDRAFT_223602 [Sistotremastrum suecicum HHB10207 ss-3]